MKFNTQLEQKLKSVVLKYLEKGRPGWDIPHTLASVYWMKQLLKYEKGDPKTLLSVMYLHDIGYSLGVGNKDVFDKKPNFKKQMDSKENHMTLGARYAKKILTELADFTGSEIKKIVYLVRNHDYVENIKTLDQQLVFEADSLGQIDRERAKPTFSLADYDNWLNYFEKERMPKFKTLKGREFAFRLFEQHKQYFYKLR